MQVPRAQESDNGRKQRRPLEGFLRGRARKDGESSGGQQAEEQPFGFYRPDPKPRSEIG